MRRPALLVLALAVLVALPACDSGSDPSGLTGRWEGAITAEGAAYPVEVRFVDTGQTITGTGTVGLPGAPVAFGVAAGSFVGTTVNLRLAFDEVPFSGSLTGELTQRDPGRIDGTFSGPRLANGPVRIEIVAR